MEKLARFGYATKGVLYLLVGGLAVAWVRGDGGQLTDGEGVVRSFMGRSYGEPLAWITAFGLACYTLWRLVQAIWDPEEPQQDMKQVGKRICYGVSAIVHGALAVAVAQMAMGNGGGGGKRIFVAQVLRWPGGSLLVAGAALVVIGVAIYELREAYTARFMRKLSSGRMSADEQKWARRAGQLGLMAHGVVFFVIGYFLLRAASSGRSGETKSMAGALREIAVRGPGEFLIGLIAVGLVAYAVHMLFNARYLRIGGVV